LIGIWYFAEEVEAKRTSINQPKGTVKLVAIDKVTNKEHEEMLVNKVIPAIKAQNQPVRNLSPSTFNLVEYYNEKAASVLALF